MINWMVNAFWQTKLGKTNPNYVMPQEIHNRHLFYRAPVASQPLQQSRLVLTVRRGSFFLRYNLLLPCCYVRFLFCSTTYMGTGHVISFCLAEVFYTFANSCPFSLCPFSLCPFFIRLNKGSSRLHSNWSLLFSTLWRRSRKKQHCNMNVVLAKALPSRAGGLLSVLAGCALICMLASSTTGTDRLVIIIDL